MASISYPTSLSIPGPWILDLDSLRNLDQLIDSCERRMQERREELIDAQFATEWIEMLKDGIPDEQMSQRATALRKRIGERYGLNFQRRRLVVYMSKGRSTQGRTFEEVANHPHARTEIPRGFDFSLEIADADLKVSLGSSEYNRDLSISVSSHDRDFAEELFGKLFNWASDIQPKRWLQLWLKSNMFSTLLLILAVWLFALTAFFVLRPVDGPSIVRHQALELAKGGVNQSNEMKAIQLLLEMEVGYEPAPIPKVHKHLSNLFLVWFGWAACVLVAFRSPPKGALGIWIGKDQVQRQRWWIGFVSVTVPSSVLVPILLHALGLS
ncbi:MAG TPA: hypothetical protein VG844_09270 [Terracidiphilus sp.]|nr:hypothetical protein [Terracidiphilus sp.]